MAAYLAYRRDGGENHNRDAKLCAAVLQAVRQGGDAALEQHVDELAQRDDWQVLAAKLKAVLHGARDAGLAEDAGLNYRFAVELRLLLEGLVSEQ